jgi:hypothetical protein
MGPHPRVVSLSLSSFKVEEIKVDPNTSWDEEITCKVFKDLNRKLLGSLGDGAFVILGDSKEEEEDADTVLAKASPQPSLGSQGSTTTTVEGDEEEEEVCIKDGICEDAWHQT